MPLLASSNAGFVLNLLWALGLGNNNRILTEGPMMKYGDAGQFASTGGWGLAQGEPMSHYSQHDLAVLTKEQQDLVERVSKNIYRPCCNNSTHFPDCNHGMAMLGFLELAASQGASENEMYDAALALNSFWFPNEYAAIREYIKKYSVNADPKTVLGAKYSSAAGYRNILSKIDPPKGASGGSCGV